MGMFDYVRARCPKCGEMIEEQSKDGPCQLKDYTLETAPASILENMDEWWCDACESRLQIKTQIYARGWLEPADD